MFYALFVFTFLLVNHRDAFVMLLYIHEMSSMLRLLVKNGNPKIVRLFVDFLHDFIFAGFE